LTPPIPTETLGCPVLRVLCEEAALSEAEGAGTGLPTAADLGRPLYSDPL